VDDDQNTGLMQVIVPSNETFALSMPRKNKNEAVSRDLHRIGKVKIIWAGDTAESLSLDCGMTASIVSLISSVQ